MVYENLTEEVKQSLRDQLKKDSAKDFTAEFIRTTDLERSIIDRYGFAGVKLVFEDQNSINYYELGSFPEGCPWLSLSSKNIQEAIETNFHLIRAKIPDVIVALKERCRFIYAEKRESMWVLHYLLEMKFYDRREYYRVYSGGPPNSHPQPNLNLLSFNWTVPQDLKEFYSIHDGFGEFDGNFLLNSTEIKVMGEMMNPICNEKGFYPDDYSFNDLLEFFPDGTGNAQCFMRTTEGTNDTVDWDHETWEISYEVGLYEFINDVLSQIDEE